MHFWAAAHHPLTAELNKTLINILVKDFYRHIHIANQAHILAALSVLALRLETVCWGWESALFILLMGTVWSQSKSYL